MYTTNMPPTPTDENEIGKQKRPSGSGAIVGIIIIVFLMVVGALYFWGAALNERPPAPLPLIPGETANS